jgi:lipopolysaccharide transport system permease protein
MPLNVREIWGYRELLYFLAWRDLKVRYKQTTLGAAWAVLQPVLTMAIFSFFFGRLAKIPSDGVPYPLFSLAALVPWSLFSSALTQSSNSLVGSSNLLRKIYFPRLLIPLASTLTPLVDFGIALIVLLGATLWFGYTPAPRVLWLPALLLLLLGAALGAGLWLSALNVQFRDVKYAVPFLIQAWLFATPIAYPSSLLPEPWRTFYAANPMVGVVEGFRWALFGVQTAPGSAVAISALAALALLASGAFYFRRMERSFADIV